MIFVIITRELLVRFAYLSIVIISMRVLIMCAGRFYTTNPNTPNHSSSNQKDTSHQMGHNAQDLIQRIMVMELEDGE